MWRRSGPTSSSWLAEEYEGQVAPITRIGKQRARLLTGLFGVSGRMKGKTLFFFVPAWGVAKLVGQQHIG